MLIDRLQIWIKIWLHITGLHTTIIPFSKHCSKKNSDVCRKRKLQTVKYKYYLYNEYNLCHSNKGTFFKNVK